MAKPAQDAKWATSGTALIADPGVGKRDTGWIVEIPPVEFFNWWMNNVGNWIEYLDLQVDAVTALQSIYDAIVGAGGTHATLNDVVADMGVDLPAQDIRVFVQDPQTVIATQVLDKEGIEIDFHPKAFMAKGLTTVIGLQIDAKRIKIKGGRFLNFDEVGGIAIDMTANAKNCFIENNTFDNNTDEIADAGSNNVKVNNIEEIA